MDTSLKPKALLRRVDECVKSLAISGAIGIVLLWLLPSFLRPVLVYIGAIIFLANVIYISVMDYKPKGRIEVTGKAVVISGCDSGFGHMLAQKLDDDGFHVFAGCLFPDGDGAKKLKTSTSSRLHVVKMDVTNDNDIQEAVKYVIDNLGSNRLWAVVCNAGLNDGGELNWTDMETIKRVIDVNMFGVVRVAKAFLPEIMKNKGRVVAVASAAGRYTYPGMVPYCMSKQGVVSFCDGLRLEIGYRFGVDVITVEPWMFKTNITSESTIFPYIRKTWDRAPDEVKEFYPNGYPEKFIESTQRFLNFSLCDRPSEVVACLREAVIAKKPKYAYMPGTTFSRVIFWFLRRFPKPITDYLLAKLCIVHVKDHQNGTVTKS